MIKKDSFFLPKKPELFHKRDRKRGKRRMSKQERCSDSQGLVIKLWEKKPRSETLAHKRFASSLWESRRGSGRVRSRRRRSLLLLLWQLVEERGSGGGGWNSFMTLSWIKSDDLRNFDRERRETERNGGILLCERESGMDLYEREGIGNFKGREDIYIYI